MHHIGGVCASKGEGEHEGRINVAGGKHTRKIKGDVFLKVGSIN